MKVINKSPNSTTPEVNGKDNFDTLCQEFEGCFYGLEYILEDFFRRPPVKPAVSARPAVDWFGLYD